MKRLLILFSALAIVSGVLFTSPAQASTAMRWGGSSAGNTALNWAERNATGAWYAYGGTGPGYDCSGLVMTAFRHAGISLPRTTFAMLGSGRLHRVSASQARRGDLAFYGPGHVEITTAFPDMTFGAHDSGSRVGWIREWETPMFYRVY
jgi:cell wall-associated NlpC family hydrolase